MSDAVASDVAGLALLVVGAWIISPLAGGVVAIISGAVCLTFVGRRR